MFFPSIFVILCGEIFEVHEKKISGLNDKRFLIKIKLISCTGVKSISMAFLFNCQKFLLVFHFNQIFMLKHKT